MYRKTANGWRRRRLVGGQSVATVEKFINEGVAMNDEAEKAGSSVETPSLEEKTAPETRMRPVSKH